MLRKNKKKSPIKTGASVSIPSTTYGKPRAYLMSPGSSHNNTLPSNLVFNTQPTLKPNKMGSVALNIVSSGLKKQVTPSLIDNGFVFGCDIPDDLSDLDGLAKIIQPNHIASAHSSTFPTNITTHPFVSTNSSSTAYIPPQSSASSSSFNGHSSLKSPPMYPTITSTRSSDRNRNHSSLKSLKSPPTYPRTSFTAHSHSSLKSPPTYPRTSSTAHSHSSLKSPPTYPRTSSTAHSHSSLKSPPTYPRTSSTAHSPPTYPRTSSTALSHSSLKSPPTYPSTVAHSHSSNPSTSSSTSSTNHSRSSLKSPPTYPSISTTIPTKQKKQRHQRSLKRKTSKVTKPVQRIDNNPDPTSQMSFSSQTHIGSTTFSVPSFTGPVNTLRLGSLTAISNSLNAETSPSSLVSNRSGYKYGSNHDSAIEILSSSDDDDDDDDDYAMPELVDRCKHHYDSSSDEEIFDTVTRRTSPSRITTLVTAPSYFESEDEDDDHDDSLDHDDIDDEYTDDSECTNQAFSTNRVSSYSEHKKRSKKQLRPETKTKNKHRTYSKKKSRPTSNPSATVMNEGTDQAKSASIEVITNKSHHPPEQHRAGSRIWSSSLCPKGICLVAETDKNVHVIQDCPVGQVYVFRQLTSITHLQQVDYKLSSYLNDGFHPDFPVLLYRKNRNHISPFCVVLNNTKSVSPILDLIPFDKMNQMLVEVDPNDVFGSVRQEKRSSISYGFATSRSVHRNENGTAFPNFLRNTLEPIIKDLFVTMSSIFKMDLLPTWAKYKPNADRQPFAATIAKDNVLEGLTIHLTNRNNLLQPHMDAHNPPFSENSQLSIVVGASRWVDGNRIGATGYFRKSISESMIRGDVMAPLLKELSNVYSDLPPHRRHLNSEMFEASHKDGCHLDENHFTTPCNIDPMGYHALWIHSICVLQHVFHLTLLQVISVQMCMDIFPNCAYYFDQAVYELVERRVLYHGDPLAIGHHIAIRMIHYRDQYYAKKTDKNGNLLKLGVQRYTSYNSKPALSSLPSPTEWIVCAVTKLVVCLFIWKCAPTKPPLKNIDDIFNSCSTLFQKTVDGMGPLSAVHQFAVLSSIGCLPPWLRTYASVEGRVLDFFKGRYKNIEWTGLLGRRTLTTIQTYFQNHFKEIWEINRVENLLCKVYRLISPNGHDSSFVDIHRNDQILIVEVDSKYSIHFTDGKVVHLATNILCSEWELVGSIVMTPVEIATRLHIGIGFEAGQVFPTLVQLMEPINIERIKQSFPTVQNKSSLSFTF